MALPKSKKIRKIIVDNIKYYWVVKYDEDYGLIECTVGLVEKPNYTFNFMRGVDSNHVQYIHNSIDEKDLVTAITPGLVKAAIIYANKNVDWKNTAYSNIGSDAEGFSH